MEERLIKPVENNKDKQMTYSQLLGRYKAALRGKFYFEALLIEYSMIEDRLTSFLYHLGVMPNRLTLKVSASKTKNQIREIVFGYEKDLTKIKLSDISGKIKVISSLFKWVSETTEVPDDKYLKVLKKQCESLDIGGILDVFDKLLVWCRYRNEIIHSALNKNITGIYTELEDRVLEGMEYARFIDSQVAIIKKGNVIRRSMNLIIEK